MKHSFNTIIWNLTAIFFTFHSAYTAEKKQTWRVERINANQITLNNKSAGNAYACRLKNGFVLFKDAELDPIAPDEFMNLVQAISPKKDQTAVIKKIEAWEQQAANQHRAIQ